MLGFRLQTGKVKRKTQMSCIMGIEGSSVIEGCRDLIVGTKGQILSSLSISAVQIFCVQQDPQLYGSATL